MIIRDLDINMVKAAALEDIPIEAKDFGMQTKRQLAIVVCTSKPGSFAKPADHTEDRAHGHQVQSTREIDIQRINHRPLVLTRQKTKNQKQKKLRVIQKQLEGIQ